MEVIVIETQAFYNLLEEAYRHIDEQIRKDRSGIVSDSILTEEEAMKVFGYEPGSRAAFYKWVIRHNIPFTKVGGKYMFRQRQIEEFLTKKQKKLKI